MRILAVDGGRCMMEGTAVADETHCIASEIVFEVTESNAEKAVVFRMRESSEGGFELSSDGSGADIGGDVGGPVSEVGDRSNHPLNDEASCFISVQSVCDRGDIGGEGAQSSRLLNEVSSDLSGGYCGSNNGFVLRECGTALDQTTESKGTLNSDVSLNLNEENLEENHFVVDCVKHCLNEYSIEVADIGEAIHGVTLEAGEGFPYIHEDSDGKSPQESERLITEHTIAPSPLGSNGPGNASTKIGPIIAGMRPRNDDRARDDKRDGFSRGFSKVRQIYSSSGARKKILPKGNGVATEEQTKVDTSGHIVDNGRFAEGERKNLGERKHEEAELGEGAMGDRGPGDNVHENGVVFDESRNGSLREITRENGILNSSEINGGLAGDRARNMKEASGLEDSFASLDGKSGEINRNVHHRKKKSSDEKVRPQDGHMNRRPLHSDSVLGAERAHDAKRDGYITSRLFAKPLAGRDDFLGNLSSPSPDIRVQAQNHGGSMGSFEIRFDDVGQAQGWNNVYPRGQKPEPRFFHAAAVVGRKMIVAGGQTTSGPTSDVKMLHLGRMTWSELGGGGALANGHVEVSKAATPERLPLCRGHSMISWGKTVLLVGGELNPASDRVEVWSFDLESECWTKITAKGEIPAARSGQSVTRAGSILIMFGGESAKGHKLNDLHILDLKSLMWLPLHTVGAGPTPRSRHCAAMYDDRFLLIFGGASKSKPLSDVFALDFETMEWSKMRTKGIIPSPRSGHAGVLVGDKWYIAGGDNRGVGVNETLMLDVGKLTWSVVAVATPNSAVANQGLSLVLVQRKEKTMLVAFGGKGSELSNQVQVLYIMPLDHLKVGSPPDFGHEEMNDFQPNTAAAFSSAGLPCACVDVAKNRLYPVAEQQFGPRSSPGESPSTEHSADATPGLVPLRKRYAVVQEGNKTSSIRQQSEDVLSRVLRETSSYESTPSRHFKASDSLHQDLEIRFSDMEAGSRLPPIATHGSKQMRRPGGSSRRKESFDSNLSSVLESAEFVESSRRGAFDMDVNTRSWRNHASDRSDSHYAAAGRGMWEGEDRTDSQLLADLQDAMSMERRIHLINKYRQSFEMKLAASVRKNELTEGHLTAALRTKEESEKSLAAALKSRQKAEGKLAAAQKAQLELKERVVSAERAQEDSNNLCNVVHSENLRLEHDLAFLKAVLEDTQKELHSTRSVLATERARSFQLQMEVFDLKKKLPPMMSTTEVPQSTSSTQLTSSTVVAHA